MRAIALVILCGLIAGIFAASLNRDSILDAGTDYRDRHNSINNRENTEWGTGGGRHHGSSTGTGSQPGWGDNTGTGSQSGWGSNTGSGSQSGWGSNTGSGSQSGWGSNTGTGSQRGTGGNTGTGSQRGTGGNTGSGSQSGWGSNTGTGSQPGWGDNTGTGSERGTGGNTGSGSQPGWGDNTGTGSQWGSGGSGGSRGTGSEWNRGGSSGTGGGGSNILDPRNDYDRRSRDRFNTWYNREDSNRDYDSNRFNHRGYCAGIHGKVTCPGQADRAKNVKVLLTSSDHDYEDRDEQTLDMAFTSTQGHYALYGCTAHSRSSRNQLHLHLFHTCGTSEQTVQKLKAIIPDDSTWGKYRTINVDLKEPTTSRPRFEVLRFFGSVNDIMPPCMN